MRNKYMRRGILFLLAGVGLNFAGWITMQRELEVYKWAMSIGTILFGIGFLLILYSLIRKVELNSILEDRAIEHEKMDQEDREETDKKKFNRVSAQLAESPGHSVN